MKRVLIGFLFVLSGCKLYQPKDGAISSIGSVVAKLAGSECKNKNLIYITQEPSTITWNIAQIQSSNDNNSSIKSVNPGIGRIELPKGLLNQMTGLAEFDVKATSTGDIIRDRIFKEVLLGVSISSPFRFILKKLIGTESAVANGGSIEMKAEGVLEIGGRKSPIMMPVKISEKDGLYYLEGAVSIDARQPRPAVNAVDLSDKFQQLEEAMSVTLAKTLDIELNMKFKNNCLVTP